MRTANTNLLELEEMSCMKDARGWVETVEIALQPGDDDFRIDTSSQGSSRGRDMTSVTIADSFHGEW